MQWHGPGAAHPFFGTHCGSPHWSPAGRWIVFDAYMHSGVWDIWVIGSSGGKPRRLTDGPGSSNVPSFSHDGKWVYFSSTRTGRSEIFRIPFGGGAATQITHSEGVIPLESADGKTIYYFNRFGVDRMLYEIPVAGERARPVGIQVVYRAFQVMPNGIYFIEPTGKDGLGRQIRFYEFAARQSRLVQALGDVDTCVGLAVSPDRKGFLYSVAENNGRDLMLVNNFR